MIETPLLFISLMKSALKNQAELALGNLAPRQQLAILKRNKPHARLKRRDRLHWFYLSAVWQKGQQ
jgi:hypothetical protein